MRVHTVRHRKALPVIRFIVPAVPVAQPRQRSASIGGRQVNYTPTKHPVNAFKASVRMAFAEAYQGPPLEGPLSLSVVFVFPRPKGMVWKKRDMPRVDKTTKCDLDNALKAFVDALQGLAWRDDAQVSRYHEPFGKFIASGDEAAHVEVEIRRVEP